MNSSTLLPRCLLCFAALTLALHSASAEIKFDLRAFDVAADLGAVSTDGKTVTLNGSAPAAVSLQIWAQITNAAPVNNVFGIQRAMGSIISSSGDNEPSLIGHMSAATLAAPFNVTASSGGAVGVDLSSPADGSLDLVTNFTGRQNASDPEYGMDFIIARKDPLNGGTKLTTTVFASNLDPAGATVNAITNGYEFLLGTATFTADSYLDADGSFFLEWVIPGYTSPVNRAMSAIWTDGDGVNNLGSTQYSEMSAGSPVSFLIAPDAAAVPEPSSAALALGGLALLGARRRR